MADTTKERVAALAMRLHQKTEAGEIDWQETDSPTAYYAPMTAGSVIIRSRDGDGVPPFELQILNRDGVVIESGLDYNMPDAALPALYEQARRKSLAVDETLDGLLDELA